MENPLKVFITYSRKNKTQKDTLKTHLAVLEHNTLITVWHDNEILPGDRWREEISTHLKDSDILLYLVSADSLASTNCNRELSEALHSSIRTIPIIIEACDWQQHKISNFQALPESGKPIAQWKPKSAGWQNVVDGIRRLINEKGDTLSTHVLYRDSHPPLTSHTTGNALQLANFYLMLGAFDMAIQIYSNIIDDNPQLAEAYNNRGLAKGELGHHEEAIADYDEAIGINPQFVAAYVNRGVAQGKDGNYQEAIKDFDKAIALNPQFSGAHYNRGIANDKCNNPNEAIKDYTNAINSDPQYAKAYNNRGSIKDNHGDPTEAIKDYDEAIRIDSQYAEAYYNRGNVKQALEKYKDAIADYDKAIGINPQYAKAYYNRGIAKKKLKQYPQARADFQRAIELATAQGNQQVTQDARDALDEMPSA